MRPRDIRIYNWLAVAMGAKGIIYWNYQAEATGREATGYGLVARSGAATDRSQEASKNNAVDPGALGSHSRFPSARGSGFAHRSGQRSAHLSPRRANEDPSTSSFLGYYKAMWNLDLWVDFVEPAEPGQRIATRW